MNCQQTREQLPLHLYRDLSDAERAAVERHLGTCSACRAELAALGAVRQGLDAAPPEMRVDVAAIYRSESERLRRYARRWRVAAVLAIAASVVVLAARLDVRADGRHLVVRWGSAEPAVETTAQTVVVREPAAAPEVDERIKTMSALIQALLVDASDKDSERQRELERLRKEVATLQQIRKRLSQTERDVSALYTAQFGSRPTGANP